MGWSTLLVLSVTLWTLGSCASVLHKTPLQRRTFPKDFIFGVSTSAYQIEGGWNANGKGESFWDVLTHQKPQSITDGSNGDVACDSYHKFEEDVAMAKSLGVSHYRLSIAWTRLLPSGFSNKVNPDGVRYYNALFDALLANGIQPLVTLYHEDSPQNFSALGGFTNSLSVQYFVDYAQVAFDLFGDRVKMWATFNEPNIYCVLLQDLFAQMDAPTPYPFGIMEYECGYNILKAHAEVYHLYHTKFAHQKGKLSIVLDFTWEEPASNSRADREAAETRLQFQFGMYANPIVFGDYPKVVKERVANRSRLEGFERSRLPTFTDAEKKRLTGTYDCFFINHYSSELAQAVPEAPIGIPSNANDVGAIGYQPDTWESSGVVWLKVTPWGIRKLSNWIKNTYGNPDIYFTENGYCDSTEVIEDDGRINYYRGYLAEILKAIYEDKVNIKGHFAWTLMDDFEWTSGYTLKFGLYHVDFNSPNRTRTPKKSVGYLRNLYATRTLS